MDLKRLTGKEPTAFGAPAWLIDDRVLSFAHDLGFEYVSCTRAMKPFIHEATDLIEIPSNLPCFEETGVEGATQAILSKLAEGGIHVLPVHAEVEGGLWSEPFLHLIHAVKKRRSLLPLRDILQDFRQTSAYDQTIPSSTLLPDVPFPCGRMTKLSPDIIDPDHSGHGGTVS